MNAQPVARMPNGVVHNNQRRRPPKIEIRSHSSKPDELETLSRRGMIPMLKDTRTESSDQSSGYVSEQSYVRLVSKMSELEAHVERLSEQNRQQVHQIETLKGSNWGSEEGTSQLRSRIAELEEMLSKTEVQMTQCMDQRDQWQQNYEAEIYAKSEEAKMMSRMRAENRSLKNEHSQWSKLFQAVTFRSESEADAQQRLREKCSKLEHEYQRLSHQYDQRDIAFREHVKKLNGNIDELTAHGNSLAKQTGLRRTHVPVEDESEVVGAFRQLNVAVRYWCLAAWDLKPEDAGVRFETFPLARKNDVYFETDEVWLLIACIWEWLMKDVFGVANRSGKVFDLWMEEEIARPLSVLEQYVGATQKKDIAHEWRSFTVQCLFDSEWSERVHRMDDVISGIISWLLPMLKREDVETEDIQKLIQELKTEVVRPAVAFIAMLRKRYTPVYLGTPMTVDTAIREWARKMESSENKTASLEIVIVPELRRIDLEADPDGGQYQVLAEAQTYTMVDKTDEEAMGEGDADRVSKEEGDPLNVRQGESKAVGGRA